MDAMGGSIMQSPLALYRWRTPASDFNAFFVTDLLGYGLWASYSDSLSLNFFDSKMRTKREPTKDEHCEDLIC